MSAEKNISVTGIGAVRLYFGKLDLRDFIREVFRAEELERLESGSGFHVEAKIGDSMVVVEASNPPHPRARPASIYVYVDDVDAAYQRAISIGATSIAAPEDKPLPGARVRGEGLVRQYLVDIDLHRLIELGDCEALAETDAAGYYRILSFV